MKKENLKTLSKISACLGIVFLVVFIFLSYWGEVISYDSPYLDFYFDTLYNLMWIALAVSFVLGILWYVCRSKLEGIDKEIRKAEFDRQKKEKEEEKTMAYQEISDIWEYGNRTMLAVLCSEKLDGGTIHYLSVNYSRVNETPWNISINSAQAEQGFELYRREFKAKRSGNSLVGINGDEIAVMSRGKLTIGDMVLYYDLENCYVKKIKGLMEQLLTKKTIEMVRIEHLKAGEEIIDALPRFHFSVNENGIMCDEINYPQKHLEDFFERNNGGNQIFQNKIFYVDYCKNNGLYDFSVFEERDFLEYMREMHMQAIKSGYSCYTDFQLSEWQVSIKHGVERLFKSFKSYVDKKTLDVVPTSFAENTIYFEHKLYSPKKNEKMLFHNLAIASMIEERTEKNPSYFISRTDDGKILINIDGDTFVSVKK